MVLAAEGDDRAVVNQAINSNATTPRNSFLVFRAAVALILMLAAGNCFLKYLWWTAYSSTMSGIPKLYAQWQTASTRAAFYGWTLIVFEAAAALLLYTIIHFHETDLLRKTARGILSLIITFTGTGVLALALSWIKQ